MKRFELQKSEHPNKWVCTDTINKIVCVFEHKKFNDTQNATMLEDFDPANYMKAAQFLREMGDWLVENHRDKII